MRPNIHASRGVGLSDFREDMRAFQGEISIALDVGAHYSSVGDVADLGSLGGSARPALCEGPGIRRPSVDRAPYAVGAFPCERARI